MSRRIVGVLVLALGVLAAPLVAHAQRPAKVPRIGYLVLSPLAEPPSAERQAFLDGLRELGYVEGRNVVIEYRSANWNRELLPDLAEELVGLKVDVIVAVPGAVDAAREATKAIPIVIPAVDLLESGFVVSVARPGGNITGPGWSPAEVTGKQLQLIKEALPKAARVAVLWNPANQGSPSQYRETQAAARLLGVTLQSVEVRDPKDFAAAFSAMSRRRPDALMVLPSQLTTAYRPIILEFAAKNRLPTMFSVRADVDSGGLLTYSPSLTGVFRSAASYIDRILKGARPGDLPIEHPTKFELIVNLKTAKALGITLPSSILLRADTVIEP